MTMASNTKYCHLTWDSENWTHFTTLFLSHQVLWDHNDNDNNVNGNIARRHAYKDIASKIGTEDLKFSVDDVIVKVVHLKNRYEKELRSLLDSYKHEKTYKSQWHLFDLLDASLREITCKRKGWQNIQITTEPDSLHENSHFELPVSISATQSQATNSGEIAETIETLTTDADNQSQSKDLPDPSCITNDSPQPPCAINDLSEPLSTDMNNSAAHRAKRDFHLRPRVLKDFARFSRTGTGSFQDSREKENNSQSSSTKNNNFQPSCSWDNIYHPYATTNTPKPLNVKMKTPKSLHTKADISSFNDDSIPVETSDEVFCDHLRYLMQLVGPGKRKMRMQVQIQQLIMQYMME